MIEWQKGMAHPQGTFVLWTVADGFRAHLLRTDGTETIYRIREQVLAEFLSEIVMVGSVNIGTGPEEPPKPMQDVVLRKTLLRNAAALASDLAKLDIGPYEEEDV